MTADRGNIHFGCWTCGACGEVIAGDAASDPVAGLAPKQGWYFPQYVPDRQYSDDVPAQVAEDARDAHRCHAIGAWRAMAAMARRAIQGACNDKGAPDERLVDQIDWLEGERIITPQMKDVAHRIRLGGNVGAHPDRDGLEDVDEDDSQDLLEFLEDFIKYVYEIPERLAKLQHQPSSQEADATASDPQP
ncbi:MAG TPA: DUF4145 domain-containing protein [Planctomycetota bacterium]|nr:DUF4145 domain-containing protein [Planctomycetota bacterium]